VLDLPDKPSKLPPIFTYLDARIPLRAHEHVAILHCGEASAVDCAGFLSEGLSLGDCCCYLAPVNVQIAMETRLRELGVDVDRHLDDDTLQIPPALGPPDGWVDWAKSVFLGAELANAPGVRILEEDVQPAAETLPTREFFEFHSRLNYLVKHYRSVVLCQYDAEYLKIQHLFSVIAVHRHLLVEGTLVRDNPFYIPAEKFLAMSTEDRDLREVYHAVGFDVKKLLATLAGYGQLQGSKQ